MGSFLLGIVGLMVMIAPVDATDVEWKIGFPQVLAPHVWTQTTRPASNPYIGEGFRRQKKHQEGNDILRERSSLVSPQPILTPSHSPPTVDKEQQEKELRLQQDANTIQREANNIQREIADYTCVLIATGVVTAVLQILLTLLQMLFTLKVGRRAQQSSDEAKRMMQAMQRAYLSVTKVWSEPLQVGSPVVLYCDLSNSGRTPAVITGSQIRSHVTKENVPPLEQFSKPLPGDLGSIMIGANQSYTQSFDGDTPSLINPARLTAVMNGSGNLFVYGCIEYQTLGETHDVVFLVKYDAVRKIFIFVSDSRYHRST